ncbi:MHS family MFS transporter [Amycolatopsis sp. K13G38]|uniref:MHS family MFS transporter n=1 Tax=Amycolatopsis acididurans TaxID=2724524 RepID=A0ABX1J918_9PSEU|nr:MFS transporter [Amycolatopsis acididurans]NKQ56174.1 MHS family MFS transporter [Amycolatopsis acididurans]
MRSPDRAVPTAGRRNEAPSAAESATGTRIRQVVVGGAVGSFVEWYEFAVYGVLASTLAHVFFSGVGGIGALLATFAVFALAFAARPLGGILWGNVADRLGRRRALTMTILTTSIATALIGALPSAAAVGIISPVLLTLLRMVQGIGGGGETPGAVCFVAEHSKPERRGLNVAAVQAGAVAGTLAGALLPGIMTLLVASNTMAAWGWRVPFLIALPLGLIGLYIRNRLEETPAFAELAEAGNRASAPIREALTDRDNRITLVKAIGIQAFGGVTFYLLLGYLPSYASNTLHLTGWRSFSPTIIAVGIALITTFLGAWLSDRVGRRRLLIAIAVGFIVLSYPCFMLITSGSQGMLTIGLVVFGALAGAVVPIIAVTFVELFPTRTRTTNFGIAFNVSQAVFAGSTPLLLTSLQSATSSPMIGGYFVAAVSVLSLVALLAIKETAGAALD